MILTLHEWLETYRPLVSSITGYGLIYNEFSRGLAHFSLRQYSMEHFLQKPHQCCDIPGVLDEERAGEWVYTHEWLEKSAQEQELCSAFGFWIPKYWEYSMMVYADHPRSGSTIQFDPEYASALLRKMGGLE